MSLLTGPRIEHAINFTKALRGSAYPTDGPLIDIEPFDPKNVGPNSVDLRLSPDLLVYDDGRYRPVGAGERPTPSGLVLFPAFHDPWFSTTRELDMRTDNPTFALTIPGDGLVLLPGILYLGSTVEKTATAGCVPCIETRSSVARLGVSTHLSAGFGDNYFGCGPGGEVDALKYGATWTLELTVAHPVRVYAGARVAQVAFTTLDGPTREYAGKYRTQAGPVASRCWADREFREPAIVTPPTTPQETA